MASEASLRILAPAGSRWRFKFGQSTFVSEGIHPTWRDPSDWTEGVEIVPVISLRSETNPHDCGTVRESDLRDAYERIDTGPESKP